LAGILYVPIVDLIRKPNDRRTLTIVVPYAIRVRDQCWPRKWGGNDVGGERWEGGVETARAARVGR
jgi:hypothetical protein